MKPHQTFAFAASLGFAALAVAACETTPRDEPGSPTAVCRPEAAERLAGRDRMSDQQARDATGASVVRQIAPGQPVTLDMRRERVTLETDPATNKIVRASCG